LRPKEAETVTLRVSAPGYRSASIKVTTGGRTDATVVDVQLMPQRTDAVAGGGVAEQSPILGPSVPNPFDPQTTLSYTLADAGHATIRLYDPTGRVVTTLVDRWLGEGTHVVRWDGCDAAGRQVAPGVYVATLRSGAHKASWRMIRAR
jgi:hypothetical protein